MNPLVSILMPAYNAAPWIADSIGSALAQTWPNKEIVVVDDGSSDGTGAIARRFESAMLKVIAQPNAGAAAARNRAFAECRGDFVQWLDADDLLGADKIARQMAAIARGSGPTSLLSSAWGQFYARPERTRFMPTSLWRDLDPIEWHLRYLVDGAWMQTATWLVRRDLAEAAGPWDTRLLGDDDGEYFSRVILAGDGTRFVPEAKVYQRRTANSLSHIGMSERKLEAQFLSMRLQIAHLRAREDSARVRQACLTYLQRFLICFYPEMAEILGQAEGLAAELGGQLGPPRLPWKYAWVQKLFGWNAAKRAQLYYNEMKSSVIRNWDGAMSRVRSGSLYANPDEVSLD